MGWWASDTATLHFDDCRVPADNLIGEENGGFKVIMGNFNDERLAWPPAPPRLRGSPRRGAGLRQLRETFGKPLATSSHPPQAGRHGAGVAATQAMIELMAWRLDHGEGPVAEVCMLKNQATQTLAFCA